MEHITVVELSNGMFKLKPDQGWLLKNVKTEKLYSEAVTSTPERFIAGAPTVNIVSLACAVLGM